MEKSILLHCITPEELKQIIKEVLIDELSGFKNNIGTNESDVLLTRKETCELLKINMTTLWNWTKKGKLISYGIGNRVYYKKEEVLNKLVQFT